MAEQKESSVLFSLKELMGLEEDRIKEEEAEKEARARAEMEARAAQERAAREAEEARLRAEEEARKRDEQRRREEDARLEAIRQAEIEKARVDAENRARLAAMTAQQAHEAQITALTQDKHKKRLQIMVGVIGGVLLIGGAVGVMAYMQSQEDAARKAAVQAAALKEAEERAQKVQRDFEMAQRKEEELRSSLASAKDEAEKARLQGELDKAERARAKAAAAGGGRASPGKTGGSKAKNCDPSDPLCGF